MEKKWFQVVTKKGLSDDNKVTFCTFNALAQAYTSGRFFPYASHTSLTKSKRLSNIQKQIHALNPDVLCLQEVDADIIDSFWKAHVASPKGYTVYYAKKPTKNDGEAIMWKTDLFEPLPLRFDEIATAAASGIKSEAPHLFRVDFDQIPECCMSDEQKDSIGARSANTSCIATAVVLKHKSSGALFVFTTVHIFWRWMFTDVQAAQIVKTGELAEALVAAVKQQYPADSASAGVFLIIAGDMNADATQETYMQVKGRFPHSAYEVWPEGAKGAGYTNYTGKFKGWLDHIFWYDDSPERVLELDAVCKLPGDDVLSKEVAIPNSTFGSDHLPLLVRFRIPSPLPTV